MISNRRLAVANFLISVRPWELGALLKWIFCWRREWLEIGPFKLWIDLASNFGQRAATGGHYEPRLTSHIQGLLRKGDTFVDLGANEGWFTMIGAASVGPVGRILAIEPQERLWPVILRNLAQNKVGNVNLVGVAIGDSPTDSEITMSLTPSVNTGASSVIGSWRTMFWPKQSILLTRLDSVLENHQFTKVRLMKVDIEGFELAAVRGAAAFLSKGLIEHLLIETHPKQLAQLGASELALNEYMASHGYNARELEDKLWHYWRG